MPGYEVCNINGYNIAYHKEGTGEPLIMVHGITTYSFIWRKVIPLLKDKYQIYAIDLLGCGDSDKPLDVDYSIKNQASFIVEFIKKMNLKKVHLVTHDIGGGVAQIVTANNPELLYDVTLINTVAYDFWPVQPIIAMRTPIIRQIAMASLDIGAFSLLIKRGLYNKDILNDELMSLFWRPLKTRIGRKAFLHLAECLNNNNLLEITDKLELTSVPMLIIRGEDDIYLSGDISEKLHKNIASSKLVKIINAGHYMMEEVPELISEALQNFYKNRTNNA